MRRSYSIRNLPRGLWLLLALSFGCCGQAAAQDAGQDTGQDAGPVAAQVPVEPTQETRITDWIRDLQSDQYVTRRKAFLELWAQGAAALPQVNAALSAKEPQTAIAARTLELLLRLEITPKDNDELAELANLTRGSVLTTFNSLAQKGHWRLARELLKINESLWTAQLQNLRFDDLNEIVQAAFDQGDSTQAWPAISLLLPPHQRQYLAYRARQSLLAQTAVEGVDSERVKQQLERLSPNPADLSSLPVDEQALYLLYEGKVDEAWALETSSATRFRIVAHSGRWPWLKDTQVKSMVLGATAESVTGTAQQAAFEFLADDLNQSDLLLAQVQREIQKSEQALPIPATDELLDSLLLCGDGATLTKLVPTSREYLLHFQNTLQYERGLEAWGLTKDMPLDKFEAWTRKAIAKISRNTIREIRTLGEVAQFLVAIGEVDHGRYLFRKLFDHALNQGSQERQEALDSLMSAARRAQLRKTAIELLDSNDAKINNEVRQIVLLKLYSEWRQSEWQYSADRLYNLMPAGLAKDDEGTRRWRVLERLWRGDPSLVTDPKTARLVEDWLEAVMQDSLKVGMAADRVCPELARIATRLNLQRLTQSLLKASPRIPLNETAEILFLNNSLESACRFWEAAISRNPSQHEWIRKQVTALNMLGDKDRANEYELSLWLRPLSPDLTQRSETSHLILSMDLFRQGLFDQARQHAETATALSETDEPYVFISGEWLGRNCLELEDFAGGAKGWRIAAINMFMARTTLPMARDAEFEERESAAAYMHLMQSVADIEAGKLDTALNRIARYESMRPGGIEIGEHCYGRMVKAGRQAEADQLIERCAQRMRAHLEKWPKDAGNHNNYAWMLARCNVQLSEARKHAELAVDLSEREPTYLDTLAEVEFRQGNFDNAIELAKECLSLDPRHTHYRTQLERFRSERR